MGQGNRFDPAAAKECLATSQYGQVIAFGVDLQHTDPATAFLEQ